MQHLNIITINKATCGNWMAFALDLSYDFVYDAGKPLFVMIMFFFKKKY